MEVLGLIPARSGSQRVKNKNIRLLNGKPLIYYTIKAAIDSKLISRVLVTTDSEEIQKFALKNGVEAPFLRPIEISGEFSTEYQFHKHALEYLNNKEGYKPDIIVNLYPTSPFRKPETIDSAIRIYIENIEFDSLRSIVKCKEHPYKMWVKEGIGLRPFIITDDSSEHTLSYQLLPEVFIQNASIYICKYETIEILKSTVGNKVLSFEMDEIESLDINQEIDFEIAKIIAR